MFPSKTKPMNNLHSAITIRRPDAKALYNHKKYTFIIVRYKGLVYIKALH